MGDMVYVREMHLCPLCGCKHNVMKPRVGQDSAPVRETLPQCTKTLPGRVAETSLTKPLSSLPPSPGVIVPTSANAVTESAKPSLVVRGSDEPLAVVGCEVGSSPEKKKEVD